jgi:4-hydroxy-2-oxoheptanedioate aldolase
VCVDLQHGGSDESTMVSMFSAIEAGGATPLARVAWNEPWMIMRVLDLGAAGVIVPLVGSQPEAARVVQACRFPPDGQRSYGPLRAEMTVGSADPQRLGADVLCFVMVETADGLTHLDEIASTPGLDGIYVGPSDLAIALGLTPGQGGDELERAIGQVLDVCRDHDLIAGMHCRGGEEARRRAQAGFHLITIAVDTSLFKATVARELAQATATEAPG